MTERPQSPLPRDPEYWDRLSERIRQDARGPLAAYAAVEPWYALLDRAAPWVAAAAVAAMLLVWLAIPGDDGSTVARWIERSVTPDDPAALLVGRDEPPNVEVLLAQFPPAGIDRQEDEQ